MDIGKTLTVRNRLEWRRWLAKHHADTREIWLVYYKKASGKAGISYEESVQEGLAYGWIEGQNKSIDDERYAARFTPRRPNSNWSAEWKVHVSRMVRSRMTGVCRDYVQHKPFRGLSKRDVFLAGERGRR